MKPLPPSTRVQQILLKWFAKNRRDLPWRRTRDPYLIAVSEVMLQQTQVDRVIPKYLAWRRAWPTTKSLAQAPLSDVLKLWSGLGYNSRARRLRDAARVVMDSFDGHWPRSVEALESLPGFGPYTARAVASFAFGADEVAIDTNIRRVVHRIFFGLRKVAPKRLEQLAGDLLPLGQSTAWHAALMDFGSAVCTSRNPHCNDCPARTLCRAYPAIISQARPPKKNTIPFGQTDRFWRGAILRLFLTKPVQTLPQLQRRLASSGQIQHKRVTKLLRALQTEGLLIEQGRKYRIAR